MEKGISAVTLGSYFGVSRHIIDKLAASGVISRNADGRYDLKACTKAIYQHQQRQISGRAAADGTAEARAASLRENVLLKQAQRRLLDFKHAKESGELELQLPFEQAKKLLHEIGWQTENAIMATAANVNSKLGYNEGHEAEATMIDQAYEDCLHAIMMAVSNGGLEPELVEAFRAGL
jgi:hypothetical protein